MRPQSPDPKAHRGDRRKAGRRTIILAVDYENYLASLPRVSRLRNGLPEAADIPAEESTERGR